MARPACRARIVTGISLLLSLASFTAHAADRSAEGPGDWHDHAIWRGGHVADHRDWATIASGPVDVRRAVEVRELRIGAGETPTWLSIRDGAGFNARETTVVGDEGNGDATLLVEEGQFDTDALRLNSGSKRSGGSRAELIVGGTLRTASVATNAGSGTGIAHVNQEGGVVEVTDSIDLATGAGRSSWRVHGGSLTWGGALELGGPTHWAELVIESSESVVSGNDCRFQARGSLVFVLDADGVSPLTCQGSASIAAGFETLFVDGRDYEGGEARLTLLTGTGLSNAFDLSRAEISGFAWNEFTVEVVQEESSIVLVIASRDPDPEPEPSENEQRRHYGYVFWEHGYPTRLEGRRPQSQANVFARENPDLIVQTGYYAMRFDADDLDITGFDTVEDSDYLAALHEDPQISSPASFMAYAFVEDQSYRCRSGAIQDENDTYVRLIEAGRYLQRFDHVNLICEDDQGETLSSPIRLEISAWPDRFVISLDADRSPEVTGMVVYFRSGLTGELAAEAAGPHVSLTVHADGADFPVDGEAGDYLPLATRLSDNRVLDSRIDDATGAVVVDILPSGPGYPDFSNRHDLDEFHVEVSNPHDVAINLPLVFNKTPPTAITGSVMTLAEFETRAPSGIAVQVSKNWHGPNTSEVHRGNWIRGATMVHLGAHQTRRFVLRSVDGYWDATPAASHSHLSLIGYGGNWKWDEMALGAWGESVTLDPTMHLAGAFGGDFRPAFTSPMNGSSDHHWTENLGGTDFLVYFDADNTYRWLKRIKTAYLWTGPNLTRVLYSGVTDDDKIRATYEIMLGSTFDYLRGFHRFRYEFLGDVVDPRRLAYFQMAADYYKVSGFTEYHLGGANGLEGTFPIEAGGNEYKGVPHPFDGRWLSIDDLQTSTGVSFVNRGLILRDLTLNGVDHDAWLHRYGRSWGGDTMLFELSAADIGRSYAAGDVVEGELQWLLTPEDTRAYWGDDAEFRERLAAIDAPWRPVHDEFRYNNDLAITAHAGQLLRHYPVRIAAADGEVAADITVNGGGIGHVPIIIEGVEAGRALRAQRYVEGSWQDVHAAGGFVHAGYQGYADGAGGIDYAFTIKRPDNDLDRAWRVRFVRE